MCDTLRNTLSRGRSSVPVIRFRCRRWIRSRRSAFVVIFIQQLPATSFQLPATSFELLLSRSRELGAGEAYLAPVLPAFFFNTSPVYRTPFCLYGSGLRRRRMLAATCPTS